MAERAGMDVGKRKGRLGGVDLSECVAHEIKREHWPLDVEPVQHLVGAVVHLEFLVRAL